MFCKKFCRKIHQVNIFGQKYPNLPSKIYLCYLNTLLNKLRIFANIEYKQLLMRGINQLKYEQRTFCKG